MVRVDFDVTQRGIKEACANKGCRWSSRDNRSDSLFPIENNVTGKVQSLCFCRKFAQDILSRPPGLSHKLFFCSLKELIFPRCLLSSHAFNCDSWGLLTNQSLLWFKVDRSLSLFTCIVITKALVLCLLVTLNSLYFLRSSIKKYVQYHLLQ